MRGTFEIDGLPSMYQEALSKMGVSEPTDIQAKMIPEALQGQSIIARSQTGTGKTLAFLLPALAKINSKEKGLQVLILAPTQELAMQIVEVARELTKEAPIEIGSFIGGANVKRQLERLKKKKPQLAVGTPGRVLELVDMKKLKLHELKVVAVDEADRMLGEKSSWDAFTEIAKRAGRDRQFLFVSATLPDDFADMIASFAPFTVEMEAEGGLLVDHIEHLLIRVEARERVDMARKLIHAEKIEKGIVFVNQLEKLAETTEKLVYRKIKAASLSSDSTKQEREKALNQFRKGDIHILVATDIAARGLDVDDVTHIIQLDPPASPDSYLHRAGRTGRMGKEGKVVTFIERKDEYKVEKYKRELGIELDERFIAGGVLTSEKPKTGKR
ncbi:ATP-dependent RNA helicase [Alkalihalophilus pseudofirmus OF4]|uniref:ATP-dependent RNA helicase n=3 Tax=Alkalihalophilus TaxID=2893060 RepID=D3FYV3_ALKPO|nr:MULTISPECIES: DEAD/DEAH box helicase [Alkalihalophilus]ADC48986.1 ATP-dependent RNA helicase [Alkalihalophilus pseudofirmus OF4]ERN52177.1 RNA helicase [Alkalihalophilus marmarensis DSM 21297]MDV2886092.1 DEAD/DEAH box helicase [Alkalihalophilus pseudofirmus]MED1600110.1 DEAD/DEAH box helicase [Alkalihalophilus marmarensis]WEG16385.1 DEAD/DEAH box helicase [Alkalihalophilus pseudofirmus]